MPSDFLLYGCNGFMGEVIARSAVQSGLKPIVAGRNAARVQALGAELGLEHRVFSLDDPAGIDRGLADSAVLLNCAGPYVHTAKPMVDGCLRTGTHYLDISGEMAEYQALAARDAEAKARGVMLLPGVGFDVVAADCLALHLKQRLPSAIRLTLGFQILGPGPLPPGTITTIIDQMSSSSGISVIRNGQLEKVPFRAKTRMIDFGQGPVKAMALPWAGDVFMAFHSTGIPNIEEYPIFPSQVRAQMMKIFLMRPLLGLAAVRRFLESSRGTGPTPDERAQTRTHVWGEAADDQGRTAVSRLHGPEAGVTWASSAALAAVRKVLAGSAPQGFQTPARAYGSDLVLECEGVTREDVN